MSEVVYLKLEQSTQVRGKTVSLGQLGTLWCRDKRLEEQCRAIQVMKIPSDRRERYVVSVMDLIRKIEQVCKEAEVSNVGETDCIIEYRPLKKLHPVWDWIKAAFVCMVSFFGSAFAIMTFNNDGDVSRLFQSIYTQVMGTAPSGPTILELTYSIGLPLGILVFFNHFSKMALSKDPTPIEVQMRTYETDVNTTLIKEAGREEKDGP